MASFASRRAPPRRRSSARLKPILRQITFGNSTTKMWPLIICSFSTVAYQRTKPESTPVWPKINTVLLKLERKLMSFVSGQRTRDERPYLPGQPMAFQKQAENNVSSFLFPAHLDKPECQIEQNEDDGYIVLTCEALANPEEVTFGWHRVNATVLDEDVTSNGLISQVRLDPSPDNFGTYYCYVNNSIGAGQPCEIDVQGKRRPTDIAARTLDLWMHPSGNSWRPREMNTGREGKLE